MSRFLASMARRVNDTQAILSLLDEKRRSDSEKHTSNPKV
jgi:hypothetical protein